MTPIEVVLSRCTGCGECLAACPFFALELTGKVVEVAPSCNGCGACLPACPEGALVQVGGEQESRATSGGRALWVWLPEGQDPTGLLGVGRGLAEDDGGAVVAVVPGDNFDAGALFARGADVVLVLQGCGRPGDRVGERGGGHGAESGGEHGERRGGCRGAAFRLLAGAAGREGPQAVLGLSSPEVDSDLARAAAILGTAFVGQVEMLEWTPGQQALRGLRSIGGGRFKQTVEAERVPAFFTLTAVAGRSSFQDPGRRGVVRHLELEEVAPEPVEVLEEMVVPEPAPGQADPRKADLRKARVVLGVGTELGSPEAVAAVSALAARWGGGIGAEKEAVQTGLAPESWLIDASVAVLTPAVYMGFGVRGSPGHNAAVTKSQMVVAVTRDATCPLAQIADYILPFDAYEVVKTLLAISG